MNKTRSNITSLGTVKDFFSKGACSGSLCHILNREFGQPLPLEESAANLLSGGLLQNGYQCGILWGAALGAGGRAFQLYGPGAQAEMLALRASQRLAADFDRRNHDINCLELTDTQWSNPGAVVKHLVSGRFIHCVSMATAFAPAAFSIVDASMSENHLPTLSQPVSCAARLAQMVGAAPQHQVMAAGLAGGIGLSGGACGALGAAVWLLSMQLGLKLDNLDEYFDPRFKALIDTFLKVTGYEFECSTISGRRFAGIEQHAGYIQSGGCNELLDQLTLSYKTIANMA